MIGYSGGHWANGQPQLLVRGHREGLAHAAAICSEQAKGIKALPESRLALERSFVRGMAMMAWLLSEQIKMEIPE